MRESSRTSLRVPATFLRVPATVVCRRRRCWLAAQELDDAVQHGVDLPQMLQCLVGSFGELDGLLVTEQAVDEAFQLVDTDLAQTS